MNIIELAKQAGFHQWYTQPEGHPEHVAIVYRFAALVRAAALEEAAGVCEKHIDGTPEWNFAAINCADAIRALTKEKA